MWEGFQELGGLEIGPGGMVLGGDSGSYSGRCLEAGLVFALVLTAPKPGV